MVDLLIYLRRYSPYSTLHATEYDPWDVVKYCPIVRPRTALLLRGWAQKAQ